MVFGTSARISTAVVRLRLVSGCSYQCMSCVFTDRTGKDERRLNSSFTSGRARRDGFSHLLNISMIWP